MALFVTGQCLDKAKSYSAIKYGLAIVDTVYLIILVCVFVLCGPAHSVAQFLQSLAWPRFLVFPANLAVVYLGYSFLDFPLTFYRSFVLERTFSLSKQSLFDWLKDYIKTGIITYCLSLVLFGTFYYILGRFPDTWWLVVSGVWLFLSVVMAKLFPVVIIPLFFKYKPLTDESLRVRIVSLAGKMGIALLNVFEIDFSKKTLKANAAFVGFGRTRRVILADTLKDKYSHDEIEVILAHEFAHYRLRHLWKLVGVNALATLAIFFIIFKSQTYAVSLFRLDSLHELAAFGLLVLYFVIFGVVSRPLENYISRKFETSADRMALAATGRTEAFISMMDKLARQNLADRSPAPIIKIFFFDHPPVDDRIALAKSFH
jgi:STE24 endopeptidase